MIAVSLPGGLFLLAITGSALWVMALLLATGLNLRVRPAPARRIPPAESSVDGDRLGGESIAEEARCH